jgi:hypothetical protein
MSGDDASDACLACRGEYRKAVDVIRKQLGSDVGACRRRHQLAMERLHAWDLRLMRGGALTFLCGAFAAAWYQRQQRFIPSYICLTMALMGLLVSQHRPFSGLDRRRYVHKKAYDRYSKLGKRIETGGTVPTMSELEELICAKQRLDRLASDCY